MRASVGFCAVACIERPSRVLCSSRCSATTAPIATASTTRLCVEITAPKKMQIDRRGQRRKRLRVRAVEILHHLLDEQRQRDGGYHQRQHAVLEHRIDDDELEYQAEQQNRERDADQNGEPERRAEIHRLKDEERRQHDEFALGEIDRLRGLPQQRKADGDQGVDRPGREARHQKLNERCHRHPPFGFRPALPPGGRFQ